MSCLSCNYIFVLYLSLGHMMFILMFTYYIWYDKQNKFHEVKQVSCYNPVYNGHNLNSSNKVNYISIDFFYIFFLTMYTCTCINLLLSPNVLQFVHSGRLFSRDTPCLWTVWMLRTDRGSSRREVSVWNMSEAVWSVILQSVQDTCT